MVMHAALAVTSLRGACIRFQDCDAAELGGRIQWQAPADVDRVTSYLIYFARSTTGASKQLMCTASTLCSRIPEYENPRYKLDWYVGA